MPETNYTWLPRTDILSFEEIAHVLDAFLGVGVTKIRLTGGEPLLRRHLERLVAQIAARSRVADLALTTNGLLLDQQAAKLRAAGLHRITVSLDTLRRDRFRELTRHDGLADVLKGIEAARAHFQGLKIDSVVIRGVNDDEMPDLVEFGRQLGAEVRFIEYMDVGGATRWSVSDVVSRAEILQRLEAHYGCPEALPGQGAAPAARYRLPDGTVIGIISSTTEPFCADCDRSRLTADGMWLLCLYSSTWVDLRRALRDGMDDAALAALVEQTWIARTDAGAEAKRASNYRGGVIPVETLRSNPHLEMHTRGG